MSKRHFRELFLKLAGICILVELCLESLLVLVGWYFAWDSTRSFGYQYSLSVSKQDSWERTRQEVVETMENQRFMMTMLLTGGINMVAGWIIQI